MTTPAIRIENLGKQYRIGVSENGQSNGRFQYKSLRDSLVNTAKRPWSVITKNRKLTEDNSFWALKDVSFEVQPGEVVGIIGRNGAGKSTLLKILSRITKPTTGHIELRGRVGSLLEVGTGFHPELTGRENIFLNGAILGMTRAEVRKKFDEIVAFSEIERFLDTPVKQYSSGMYTRLAFAVAAHLDPEILVVDEVLAVGDAAFQKKCLGKMKDVAGEGRTVLFVSHNMGSIRQLCSRGLFMEDGGVVYSGEIFPAVSKYLTAQSALRIGVKLDEWPNRAGNRQTIQEVTWNDTCLPAEIRVQSSFPARVSVKLTANKMPLADIRVGIHLYTEDGVKVMTTSNWFFIDSVNIENEATLSCQIDSLPITDGVYLLSVGCSQLGELVDRLDEIGRLYVSSGADVEGGAYFLREPTQRDHGLLRLSANWTVS